MWKFVITDFPLKPRQKKIRCIVLQRGLIDTSFRRLYFLLFLNRSLRVSRIVYCAIGCFSRQNICTFQAFTAAQKQRVHQWKRLARKAIRPADVRRQRIGLPHSGKCELCHYKVSTTDMQYVFCQCVPIQCISQDLSHRDNGKSNGKQNCGSSERISYHHNQQSRLVSNSDFPLHSHFNQTTYPSSLGCDVTSNHFMFI